MWMNHFFKIKIVAAASLFAVTLHAQNAHQYLRKGDDAYVKGSYPDAEVNYRRALEKEKTVQGEYNLGNSTYRQERFDEAVKHYEAAAEAARDKPSKARAFHNLGNAFFQNGKFKESAEAYKNALRLNPADLDTKRNLANALRRIPPPPPPQDQQGEGKGSSDPPPPNDQKPQDQPSDGEPNEEEQPSEPEEDENQDGQQQPSPSSAEEQPRDLSKEEARQLLEIMDREEQRVQQKLRKAQSANKKSGKDW